MKTLTEHELTQEALKAAVREQLTAVPGPSNKPVSEKRTAYGAWTRPYASEALAVDPKDIGRAREEMRAHGVFVEYDKEGRPLVESAKQYHQLAKASGLFDGAHGYGPPREGDNRRGYTGRAGVREREDFKRRVERGELDL